MRNIQKNAEVLEELLDRDNTAQLLNMHEFNAINNILLELQAAGHYKGKSEGE